MAQKTISGFGKGKWETSKSLKKYRRSRDERNRVASQSRKNNR